MPNLFPEDISVKESNIETFEEPLFKGSYLFDFEKGEFVKNPDGTIVKANDLEAYIQWCNKAMITPRYKLSYSDLYGHDFKEIIGSGFSMEAIELELKRMTKETLIVNPRTKDVNNFIFLWSSSKDEVYYTYNVETIDYKKLTLNNSVKTR